MGQGREDGRRRNATALAARVLARVAHISRGANGAVRLRRRFAASRLSTAGLCLAVVVSGSACAFLYARRAVASAEEKAPHAAPARDALAEEIEAALYTRAEFFGAQASVPYPTAEARNRLAAVAERHRDAPLVQLRLAQLDERLGRFAEAEKELRAYAAGSKESPAALEELASFLHRRADFAGEAQTLERMLAAAPPDARPQLLERLLALARAQKLEAYLRPEFYERMVAENPSVFSIVAGYIRQLFDEGNYRGALAAVRSYRPHFPAKRYYFIRTETRALVALGETKEAERVWVEAFDPFWPDSLAEEFYQFLSDNERLRAYGHELREAFRRRPDDYDLAVRLFHYRRHSYDEAASVFVRLEKARAARGVGWKPEELTTCARLLIREGEGDTASRLLYTLYAQGDFERGSDERARVLYQLFELLCDAGEQRLALTRGELSLYRNVATADPHPGLLGGVLSFIFSDTNPPAEMRREEQAAVKYFNRAAAYRIFDAYRQEYPTSPQLAQMYLDIVRLYTATNEPDVAAETLAEFERRYADAPHFPEVALKLADCYMLLGRHEEERALYQRVLDHLGRQRRPGTPLLAPDPAAAGDADADGHAFYEPTEFKPTTAPYPPKSNRGINIPDEQDDNSESVYYYSPPVTFRDYMAAPAEAESADDTDADAGDDADATAYANTRDDEEAAPARAVTYGDVLARYVSALEQENRTADILALYGAEIAKYPDEQELRAQLLQWLGQTNMVEEQLGVYREALRRFPSTLWRDRLARWLIRHERKQEFADYSRELLNRLGDRETEDYLERFISSRATAGLHTFDADLYEGLYTLAHERFPHNLRFVRGLLDFYAQHQQAERWQRLTAEYYFESPDIREQFLSRLAAEGRLRARLEEARLRLKAGADASNAANASAPDASASNVSLLPYKLFRADAAVRLSNYEEAVDAYRELNRIYPNTPEFAERLVAFTRSLGQHNRRFLEESAALAQSLADARPSDAAARTRAGEIFAELGDYERARGEWSQLVSTGRGDPEVFLDAATVYWDYYQYADALQTIETLRRETGNPALYAFQVGAILEAQHKLPEAVEEYARALDEGAPEYLRAKRRLTTLYARPGVAQQLAAAYRRERAARPRQFGPVLGYVGLLKDADKWDEAARVLSEETARSDDANFLARARSLFDEAEDSAGGRAALKRLAQVAASPRAAISYRLQLAEDYAEAGERAPAASTLAALLGDYPNNYGVLSESASFYWRLGLRDDALRVLREGMRRGRGRFRYTFARGLAARQVELEHFADARRVLEQLNAEDPLDLDVFRELARVYVRTGAREQLRAAFRETLKALRAQDLDIKEIQAQVAELRSSLVVAFTQLKDYAAAMEQHIEIINREPEDEDKLGAAVAYARRYGGAEQLLEYYRRLSQQAYKNYRWNVVLARLYEAKGDLREAARSYRAAIGNQPELVELYDALAAVEARAGNYDGALAALAKASELTNDDPQYVKRTVEVLERAGRTKEAEAERQKLPPEVVKPRDVGDQFAAAANLRREDQAKAVAAYRKAFADFSADPFRHELQSSEITGYVQALHHEEQLDSTARTLWALRERLARDASRPDGADAGKARSLLRTLDGALPEALGSFAARSASGDELGALYRDLDERIAAALKARDQFGTLDLLQNVAHRAGFGVLEEKILVAQKEAAHEAADAASFHAALRSLAALYAGSGDYQRAAELLEREQARDAARQDFEYPALLAEYARLTGDTGRELKALEAYYQTLRGELSERSDPRVGRYFELLYERGAEGRETLRRLAATPHPSSLQLVNFLVARGETALAHEAIERSSLPRVWKLARNAEVSLALGEFDARGEGYFADALQLKTIGELVAQRPDAGAQLVGDDWFRMTTRYGRWLASSGSPAAAAKARAMLPAGVENSPHDASEQARLGRFYLERGDPRRALAHLELARELDADSPRTAADLGSAHFLLGRREEAFALWSQLIAGDEPEPASCLLFLETLRAHRLAPEARERLLPVVVRQLEQAAEDDSTADDKKHEPTRRLLRALAASFAATTGDGSASPEAAPSSNIKAAVAAASPNAEASGGAASPNVPASPAAANADAARDGEASTGDETAQASARLAPAAAREQAAYLLKLAEAVPDDTLLAELVVNEKLVAREHLGEFYRLLVERSPGLTSYDYDYSFSSAYANSFNPAETEEAFDHENDYPAGPENERLKWQQAYVEYLLGGGHDAEAARLVSSVEAELRRRYPRPVWLRLAACRLEVRGGRLAEAMKHLRHFVGAETDDGLTVVAAPSIERLNAATAMLRAERQQSAAAELLSAAYARFLALEQYEAPYFDGLARLAYERGDADAARKLLRLMLDLAREETRDSAAAEVSALPEVKAADVDAAQADAPEASNELNYRQSLGLAADAAATYGDFAPAVEWRAELGSVSPDDYVNRLELARLLAAEKKFDEGAQQLAAVIADRDAPRAARWQAVWLAPEVTGGQGHVWSSLVEQVGAASPREGELTAALRARELMSEGQAAEALRLVESAAAQNPNPQLKFFAALLAAAANQDGAALTKYAEAQLAVGAEGHFEPFAFDTDAPTQQLIRLYLARGQAGAAFRLAESLPAPRPGVVPSGASQSKQRDADGAGGQSSAEAAQFVPARGEARPPAFLSLSARASARRLASGVELLELLSRAAEESGDLPRAIEFAEKRAALGDPGGEHEGARDERLERLRALQRARTSEGGAGLVIDRKLLAQK